MAKSKANLELHGTIGFAGTVPSGLVLHNDDARILYPLGSTVVVKHLTENTQHFLECGGSETSISAIQLSRDGTLLAVGQKTHPGFPVSVFLWDLESCQIIHRFDLHKGKIQGLAFSPSGQYLASLGGEEDNKLVVWDVKTGDPICGSPASSDSSYCVSFSNLDDHTLVTAGKYTFRIWSFDRENRKIRPTDCALGQLKRVFNCLVIDPTDSVIYAGTQSGDLLQISLEHCLFQKRGPANKAFSQGIQSVTLTNLGGIIVGGGDGTVALLDKETLKVTTKIQLEGTITSLVLNAAGDHVFVGTGASNLYLAALDNFEHELRSSAHPSRVNCVVFPDGSEDLFVTAGYGDIRVWRTSTMVELLRIKVPNLECSCVQVTRSGSAIVSGWNDGKIRAFYPESGRLMYTIHNAHEGGVTAVGISSDHSRVVSGGVDGNVRVWSIEPDVQNMLTSLKEHKSAVSYISINEDDTQFVSSSHDGSCVVWDLQSFVRLNAMFASTQFSTVLYHPDQSQFLTTGTDHQITYWDAVECTAIRIVDGAESGGVNSLSITKGGDYFVSGSNDKLVKMWHYDEGVCEFVGTGHSGHVLSVAVSPENSYIVSTGEEGAVLIWRFPEGTRTEE